MRGWVVGRGLRESEIKKSLSVWESVFWLLTGRALAERTGVFFCYYAEKVKINNNQKGKGIEKRAGRSPRARPPAIAERCTACAARNEPNNNNKPTATPCV